MLGLNMFMITNIVEVIGRMYDAFRIFWQEFGEYGLFMYSIFETITPIAGVEFFFITLVTTAGKPWWRVAGNATIANVVGAIIVYFFLAKGDNRFYNKLLKKDQQRRAERLFDTYGPWAIFIFAMTPLPFFIIIFTAAIAKMGFKQYIAAVFFSRGIRFFLTTFIIHQFSTVNTLMLVLILILVALPLSLLMMVVQKKLLAYFESRTSSAEDVPEPIDNQ